MNVADLQRAIGATDDGKWGPKSKVALISHFTNTGAKAVLANDLDVIAKRLGCSLRQLAAVGAVESSGGGFDDQGRPKLLFERHYFHRLTEGKWSTSPFSDPTPGGYGVSSWVKLLAAAGFAPDAAFASASWGRFQVMGAHWHVLGYESPFALAASLIAGEAGHYELLARFIEHNNLSDDLRATSPNPEDCRAFAKAYNGPAYEKFSYHTKLAKALG